MTALTRAVRKGEEWDVEMDHKKDNHTAAGSAGD